MKILSLLALGFAFCSGATAEPVPAGKPVEFSEKVFEAWKDAASHHAEPGLAVCGEWLSGGRVEGAFLSGNAAAVCPARGRHVEIIREYEKCAQPLVVNLDVLR